MTKRPRVLARVAAGCALLAYGVVLFLVPSILDWAFDEGGKAPMLVVMIGVALVFGTFWGVEKLLTK